MKRRSPAQSNFARSAAAHARNLRAKKATLDLPKPMNPYRRLMAKIDAENDENNATLTGIRGKR
jgi:hypothetical protein